MAMVMAMVTATAMVKEVLESMGCAARISPRSIPGEFDQAGRGKDRLTSCRRVQLSPSWLGCALMCIAAHAHALGHAPVAELLGRDSDIHEHEVGVRLGGLHAAVGEPLGGEVTRGLVPRTLGFDERRPLFKGGDAGVQRQHVERARA